MDRRAQILKYVRKDHKGIEIGPWFAPIAPKRDGYNCLSLDVFDTDRLIRNAERAPNVDNSLISSIESVDIVSSSTELANAIASRNELATFDYIISAHNFEHIPNPIKFLQGCEQVLKPGGYLSMAIPDKRLCFDFFRPVTTLGAWLDAFLADRDRPTPIQVFELDSLAAQYGGDDPARSMPHRNVKAAYETLITRHANNDMNYNDTHCSTFTPSSFKCLILDLSFLGLTGLSIKSVTEPYGNEFFVHFCKEDTSGLNEGDYYDARDQLLRDIQDECAVTAQVLADLRKTRAAEVSAQAVREKAQDDYIQALIQENDRLKGTVAQLEADRSWQSEEWTRLRNSLTWKAASPFWRLETHGARVAARRLSGR